MCSKFEETCFVFGLNIEFKLHLSDFVTSCNIIHHRLKRLQRDCKTLTTLEAVYSPVELPVVVLSTSNVCFVTVIVSCVLSLLQVTAVEAVVNTDTSFVDDRS